MNTPTELESADHQLDILRQRFPGLSFEDRLNPKHLAKHSPKAERRKPKPIGGKSLMFRFRAFHTDIETISFDAIHKVRSAYHGPATFTTIVAFAGTPERLGEILSTR
jgi:hypothetical protein